MMSCQVSPLEDGEMSAGVSIIVGEKKKESTVLS